jgi:hypothetical protein
MEPDPIHQAAAALSDAALYVDDAALLTARVHAILAPLTPEEAGAACVTAIYGLAQTLRRLIEKIPEPQLSTLATALVVETRPPAAPSLPFPQTACKSCGAAVAYVPHVRTQTVSPLNVTPDPAGNIIIENSHYRIVSWTKAADEVRYTSHFATCPQAPAWHRPA